MFKNYKENEIITIKLSSGEEILCKFLSATENHITVEKGLVLMQGPQGVAGKIAQGPEFKVLVHLLKMIIDQQVGIPNKLGEKINALSEHFNIDEAIQKTVH